MAGRSGGLSHRSIVWNYQHSIRSNVKLDQVVRQLVKQKAIQRHVGNAIRKSEDWDLFIAVLRDSTEDVFFAFLEILESTSESIEAHGKLLKLLGGEGGLGQYSKLHTATPAAITAKRVTKTAKKLIEKDTEIGKSEEALSMVGIPFTHISQTQILERGVAAETVSSEAVTNNLEELSLQSIEGNQPLQGDEPVEGTPISDDVSKTNAGETDQSTVPQTLTITASSEPSLCPSTCTVDEYLVQPPLFVGGIESETFTQTGGVFYSPIHGISVDIPEQAIPSHVSSFEIKMRVCLHGPFIFPYPDIEICSAVVCLSCEPSFDFVSDVTVEIPHCAIIDSESDREDYLVLRASDSEDSPYWNFSEVLESKLSTYHVTVKVQHFSKVANVFRKNKRKQKSKKKRDKLKKLKEGSLDSNVRYTRQSSLGSDQASGTTRKRAFSTPASISGTGSKVDMLSSSSSEFTVVCCAPQDRLLPSWMVACIISYSHPTGWMVAKQTAQNVLGCSLLSLDPIVNFTFDDDEEVLEFEPAEWKQDGWSVEAMQQPLISREKVVQYNKLPEEKQLSLVEFCPHLMYIIEGTDCLKPLKCKILVKGANFHGRPVFFMLTSSVPFGMQRGRNPGVCPARQEETSNKTLNVQNLSLALTQVTNWHTLGIRLGVPPYQLKHIEQNYSMNSERCKNEMLSVWLQTSPAACWRDVVRALHEMEHHVLAKIIHRDYDQARVLISTELLPDSGDLKLALCSENPSRDVIFDLTKLDHQNFLAEISLQLVNCKCLPEELDIEQSHTTTNERGFESVYQMLRQWVQQKSSEATLSVLSSALMNLGSTLELSTCNYQVDTTERISSESLYIHPELAHTISMKIASQWKFVGRFLGLSEQTIQHIDNLHGKDKLVEQAYYMLSVWKQQCRSATCHEVEKAISTVNKRAVMPFCLNDACCYVSKYIKHHTQAW